MFKLLTDRDKEEMLREYTRRRYIVMLAAFILVILIWMIGLFPSYVISTAKYRELLARAEASQGDSSSQGSELRGWISKLNSELQVLAPELDQKRPSADIQEIIFEKMPGISITDIEWIQKDAAISISLSGVARDRQILISFEDKLNSSGKFKDVALPVSNLAKDKDLSFQIKLSPKQTQQVP